MTVSFALIAGALVVLAAGFAAFPLLRDRRQGRDEAVRASENLALYEQRVAELEADLASGRLDAGAFSTMKDELGADLLDSAHIDSADVEASSASGGKPSWRAAAVVASLVVIAAVAGYAQLGAMDDVRLAVAVEGLRAGAEPTDADLANLVDRLQARLDRDPDDASTWYLLGHALMRQSEFAAATMAFEQLHRLTPGDLSVMVSLAQARYLKSGTITPNDRLMIDRILQASPHEPMVREILALDEFQRGEYAAAVGNLRQALRGSVSETRAQALRAGLARAEAMAAQAGQEIAEVPAPSASGGGFDVTVTLDSTLGPVPDSAVLFVLARKPGQRMPVMVVRRTVTPGKTPDAIRVRLDQATAMNPAMLPGVGETLEVVARLAMSGTAAAGPDDVEAVSEPLLLEANLKGVRLQLGTGSPPETGGSVAAAGGFEVTVTLDPALGPLPEGAALFVLARKPGQRMPVMVVRRQPGQGSISGAIKVRLDQTTAMNPAMPPAVGDALEVVARLAMSGTAARGPGDLEAVSEPLALEAEPKGVRLHLASEALESEALESEALESGARVSEPPETET